MTNIELNIDLSAFDKIIISVILSKGVIAFVDRNGQDNPDSIRAIDIADEIIRSLDK